MFPPQIHAQEIKTCRSIVVQPGGDWAPQRRDKIRRTMPYPSAQHAIKDAATDGKTSTYHTKADIRSGSTIYLRAGNHDIEEMLIIRRGVTIAAEDGVEADSCLMMIEEHCLVQVRAPSVRLENITMRQVLGDGDEDYWSGGLFVIKAVTGSVEINGCVITSDRGSGLVVTGSGTAVMTKCQVLDCGHYGVAADGKDALIDMRDCQVDGSKFEDFDERNGARIVGIPGRE